MPAASGQHFLSCSSAPRQGLPVPGNVCDVSEPSVAVCNHIDKVSTDRSARERCSEQFKFAGFQRQLWDKRAVNLSREPNFSMRGEEAFAFPLEKQQKQYISATHTDQDAGRIHL